MMIMCSCLLLIIVIVITEILTCDTEVGKQNKCQLQPMCTPIAAIT